MGSQFGDQPSIGPSSRSHLGWETHASRCHVRGPRPRQTPGQSTQGLGERTRAAGEPSWGNPTARAALHPPLPVCDSQILPPGDAAKHAAGLPSLQLQQWLARFPRRRAGGRAGLGEPRSPLRRPQWPPHQPLARRGRPPQGIKCGPRHPTSNTLSPTLSHLQSHPLTLTSQEGTLPPASREARPSIQCPTDPRPEEGRLSNRHAAPLPRVPQSRCSEQPAAGPPRPPRGPEDPQAPAAPRGPYLKAGGWAARSAPRSVRPSSQGAEAPAQSPPSQLPPRSLRRAPSGCGAAQAHCRSRRAAPHQPHARPHASAPSHSVRTRRARAMCAPVLRPRTRTTCTCNEHTGPQATGVHLPRALAVCSPALTRHAHMACTH